jgi:serine protease Do
MLATLSAVHQAAAQAAAPAIRQGDLKAISHTLEALSEQVAPAVVQVFAVGYSLPDGSDSDDKSLLSQERSTGSGVIVDPSGYIVTNAHVVEGAHRVQVQIQTPRRSGQHSILNPRPRVLNATIVAQDDETDLAVLKVDETGLPALPIADSDTVKPGELVLAFGSPMGLDSSVTLGVVSAVARQLEADDPMIYIQTDASINPGNSGGPLVDTEGRMVGINTLILSQSGGNEGLGFAAPSNIVRNVFEQVREYGHVRRGEIGVRPQTITPALAEGLHLARDWGVVLGDVVPEGPAARAGLQIGDIVVALDGKAMENGRQLQVNLYGRSIGETVTVRVLRGDRTLDLPVIVVERSDDPNRFAGLLKPEDQEIPRLGIIAIELTRDLEDLLPQLRASAGVIVALATHDVPPEWEGELKPGDVIHAANGTSVKTLADLRAALALVKSGGALTLQVERDGSMRYVAGRID